MINDTTPPPSEAAMLERVGEAAYIAGVCHAPVTPWLKFPPPVVVLYREGEAKGKRLKLSKALCDDMMHDVTAELEQMRILKVLSE